MTIRYKLQFGWNSSSDHEWQYRKTLDKSARDAFDAMDEKLQNRAIRSWIKAQKS